MTEPLPATDREKNAWPKAKIQTMGLARPLGSSLKMYL